MIVPSGSGTFRERFCEIEAPSQQVLLRTAPRVVSREVSGVSRESRQELVRKLFGGQPQDLGHCVTVFSAKFSFASEVVVRTILADARFGGPSSGRPPLRFENWLYHTPSEECDPWLILLNFRRRLGAGKDFK